ncbi:DUF2332 domain-containing protein [Sneathiella aquimaris]|uniref:DUF2332 domain-containing protein n=1 Tax=Sneathiella aquimaris TaxID=2599305 RepID=UPI00146EAC2D|nr:DUF2332 family protein [Sneathiella aquimaris]
MSEQPILTAFRVQSKACESLGSPFMARLCLLLAENFPAEGVVWRHIANWPGDVSPYGESVPLRLTGALHALVLSSRLPALQSVYPPNDQSICDDRLLEAVLSAVEEEEEFVLQFLRNAPQTNEVKRAGILFPGFQYIAKQTNLMDFRTSELGASAGLNLFWDKFSYNLKGTLWGSAHAPVLQEPDWKGSMPAMHPLRVLERAGCDLNPLDIDKADERLRLLSYIWADQPDRIAKTRSAIDFAKTQPERVTKQSAIKWLAGRLAQQSENTVHVIYHTIAWQYFTKADQVAGERLMQEAGQLARNDSPLAWLRLEADKETPGAALSVTLWPGGETKILARADFHGRWINWLV